MVDGIYTKSCHSFALPLWCPFHFLQIHSKYRGISADSNLATALLPKCAGEHLHRPLIELHGEMRGGGGSVPESRYRFGTSAVKLHKIKRISMNS